MKTDCNTDELCETNCCVPPGVGPIYFVLFILFSAFVLMNLVVAVLLRYLEESMRSMNQEEDLKRKQVKSDASQSGMSSRHSESTIAIHS